MRIVQVISAFQLGGAERVAGNLAAGLAERGHQVLVAAVRAPQSDDPVGEALKADLLRWGVELRELASGVKGVDALSTPVRLAAIYRTWKADLVHAHTDIPDLATSLAGRLTRLRIARTIHNTVLWPTHPTLGRISESGLTDGLVIYLNDDTLTAYEEVRSRYALPCSPLQVLIRQGVRAIAESAKRDRQYLVENYGASPGKWQFCFAGRLTHQKGIDVLMKALAGLPKEYLQRAQLHVFGNGEERATILRLARTNHLPVLLHSPEPAVDYLFGAFDCVILPSRYEGAPLVAIEALSQDVPVIVTSASGLRQSVPAWWPLVAPPGDVETLADIIKRIVRGSVALAEIARRGGRWARREYAIESMVERHEDAYAELLRRNPDGSLR